jgi:Asp-tRNA(Asn)/Glu-tRNA(Gln) amidotransferase A subunit family amidase
VLTAYFGRDPIHAEVNAVVEAATRKMSAMGATILQITIPNLEDLTRNLSVTTFEYKAGLNRYFGSLGPGAPVKSLEEFIARGEFHPSLKNGLETDQKVVDGLNDPEYRSRLLRRNELRQAIMVVMADNKLDAILYPHQKRLVVPIGQAQADRNGVLSNGTGFPAIVFPGGFSSPTVTAPNGVPVGIELLGPDWSEPTLLKLAYAFEAGAHARRPPPTTPPLK